MLFVKEFKKILQIIKLFRQLFRNYKWHIVVLTGLGFLGGILGGIGVNAVIPLFSSFMGGDVQEFDAISRYIEKFFLFFNLDFSLKYLLIFIVLLFVAKAAILVLFSYIQVRITSDYSKRARSDLFQDTLQAKWPYLLRQKLGHLEKVLMINIERTAGMLTQTGTFIRIFASLVAYAVIAINISSFITLIIFGLGSLLFFLFKPVIRRLRHISYEAEQINRDIAHHVNENILGAKTVKVMSVEEKISNIGKEYFKKIRNINIRSFILSIFSGSLMEPISVIFIAAVFAIFYKTSSFNLAALVAVIYLAKQTFTYIDELQQQLLSMNATIPYLKSISNYEAEIIEHKEADQGAEPFKFEHALEFRNVHFSYNNDREVLSGINFKIKKGEIAGLIGPSGAGKTTIVDLCLRLFEPSKGQIFLDGADISKIKLKDWRKNIGYVAQDIFLMNNSIASNIRFYDKTMTNHEIEKAAKMANIYDFIQSCPNGFSTIVGERGVQISAGQRQRLIIARVLARKPKLLILDEATSALDNESERKIQQIIKSLKGKITVFVIAHRLSTVVNSDKLIALENSRIVEQGLPAQLLKDKKSYFSKVHHLS